MKAFLEWLYRHVRPEPIRPEWIGWVQSGSWKRSETHLLGGGRGWADGQNDTIEVRVNGELLREPRCSRPRYIRTGSWPEP